MEDEQNTILVLLGKKVVGKSSFINAFLNRGPDHQGAAEVDVIRCTTEPESYHHPVYHNLEIWDLPGEEASSFAQNAKFLELLSIKGNVHFFIISCNRFTDTDRWLAEQLQLKNKKFYFVRTKIDLDIRNDKQAHPMTFNEEKLLRTVREDYISKLENFHSPRVFLISNRHQDKWDFPLLSALIIDDILMKKKDKFLEMLEPDINEINREIELHGIQEGKDLLDKKLQEWKHVPLNVAVAGSSGSGKSSFINALRNLTADDKEGAPVDVKECTKEPTAYSHPTSPNLKLWDLPRVGTKDFSKSYKYLEKVKIDRYDFFLIFSSGRFTENDCWLANQVESISKKFYFVRSKIDSDIRNKKRAHPKTFSEARVLEKIREDCSSNLKSFESPPVFLISNHHQNRWDFPLLAKQMIEDIPQNKREALILSLNAVSETILKAKRKVLNARAWKAAALSGAGALIPLPGLSVAIDAAIIIEEGKFYKKQFGLDAECLEKLSLRIQKDKKHLRLMLKSLGAISQLAGKEVIKALLANALKYGGGIAAEAAMHYIPLVITQVLAAGVSFTTTVLLLRDIIRIMEKEASYVLHAVVEESAGNL